MELVEKKNLTELIGKARSAGKKRGFSQSIDLFVTLKDIDVKKHDLNITEVVFLPHQFSREAKVCIFATGDLALRAEKAGADRVVSPDDLEKFGAEKRNSRKLARSFEFFLAETDLMPRIGKSLGQFLGPRGRMPSPIAVNAPIEGIIGRYRTAVRIRTRAQLELACKIGDEAMTDEHIAENVLAILSAVEKKLPSGMKNMGRITIKKSMASTVTVSVMEVI